MHGKVTPQDLARQNDEDPKLRPKLSSATPETSSDLFKISVKDWNGKIDILVINDKTTIYELRCMIWTDPRVPVCLQRLSFQGKELSGVRPVRSVSLTKLLSRLNGFANLRYSSESERIRR